MPFPQAKVADLSQAKCGKIIDASHTTSYVLNSGVPELNLTKVRYILK